MKMWRKLDIVGGNLTTSLLVASPRTDLSEHVRPLLPESSRSFSLSPMPPTTHSPTVGVALVDPLAATGRTMLVSDESDYISFAGSKQLAILETLAMEDKMASGCGSILLECPIGEYCGCKDIWQIFFWKSYRKNSTKIICWSTRS